MKFGTMQGVLGEPLSQVFETAKDLGFDGIELDWNSPSDIQNGGPLSPQNRAGIVAAAQTAGVEIPSVCAHFLNGGGIAASDATVRQAGMQAVRDGLQLTHDVGATALLVPFFGTAEIKNDGELGQLIQSLKELVPAAEELGVVIAIEHTLRGDEAAKVLSQVGSSFVGDYWDMANCMSLGYDPLEEIAMLKGHISRVHAKEWSGPMPTHRQPGSYPGLNTVPLGQGDVPLQRVLDDLKKVGYDGYITIETGVFGDRRASARAALHTLRNAVR